MFGHLYQQENLAELVDDLYVGANSVADLFQAWSQVIMILQDAGMGLSPAKTTICPDKTTIMGWVWHRGTITTSPHRIAALTQVTFPVTVTVLRSFIGAYKVLSTVLLNCSAFLQGLDQAVAATDRKEKIAWTEELTRCCNEAQAHLQ